MPYQRLILEQQIDSVVPIYTTNINSIDFNYNRVIAKIGSKDTPANTGLHHQLTSLDTVRNKQIASPFDIRSLLNHQSGAVYGHLLTNPKTPAARYQDKALLAIVSPYQVHVKLGYENTLVWATDLQTGAPVAAADVMIYRGKLGNLEIMIQVFI